MQRRNLLIGMGSIAAGGAATIGTGAFSSVTAQRGISLNIAPDSTGNAYLNFYPNSEYAEYNSGMLELTFDGNGRGTGINSRANTLFEDVFTIQNQGTNEVDVLLPSFSDTSISGVQNPAAASTQFLVDETKSPVSGPEGVRLVDGSANTENVDHVDISWPEGIVPKNKPSNPVPQKDTYSKDGAQDDDATSVNATYTGLRYPGGAARLSPGDEVTVDVRFTVSNERSVQDSRDSGLLISAVETSASDSDWEA